MLLFICFLWGGLTSLCETATPEHGAFGQSSFGSILSHDNGITFSQVNVSWANLQKTTKARPS
jgi:hypothetical protein